MKAPKLATCLLNLLEELTRSKLKYHTGNKFDELVQSNLVGAHQISDADFKTHHSYADLRAAMKSAENDGLVHLRHQFDGFFRVDKPLGSQSWPDCLLVEGSVALGMEYKASKNGQPVWNSGLPKSRGLYLVHATGGEKLDVRTTYFLGGDVITDEEAALLRKGRESNQEIAVQVNARLRALPSRWSLYPRPMNNWREVPLKSPRRQERESRVVAFLQALQ